MVVNHGCDDGSDNQLASAGLTHPQRGGHDQKIENGLVAEKAEAGDRDCA